MVSKPPPAQALMVTLKPLIALGATVSKLLLAQVIEAILKLPLALLIDNLSSSINSDYTVLQMISE
jgi:hypothetical protein